MMVGRSRSADGQSAVSPSAAILKAEKALDMAGRLQRSGDLTGAIQSCREGIAWVADAEDTAALRLRVRLRTQCEVVTRLRREALRAG